MKHFRKYLTFAVAVAVFGEIYFYPFNSNLRFSAAIIALNLILLIDEEISPFFTCVFSGMAVFLQRSLLGILFYSLSLQDVLFLHGPSIVYYIIYGILLLFLNIQKQKHQLMGAIIILAFSDILSNTIEIFIRQDKLLTPLLRMIVLVGIARSVSAYLIFLFYKKRELFLVTREDRKKYAQLNLLVSNIQAEMFYLKKSTRDIENIMRKSYALYEGYKDDHILREKTLDIALEIHEVKKDYYRVLNGFESFLNDFEDNGKMMLSDMFAIIHENTARYLKENNLTVSIDLTYEENFQVQKYYHLFTIINNLLINAIDACRGEGTIKILQKKDGDSVLFEVRDNGEGIGEEFLPYIFNPGFTTKYDEKSGNPSTGIGLSHVKGIVDELEGQVKVTSKVGEGTTFEIRLPKNILIG
ncbi:sensor histidine kinase [Natronincola ferrireducens]|uniref:histidine kinase n=1 Tax=Natronincola ferrireducens TaxID=393762 RepID=A0A1G8XLY0_9FIRM|nr:sensor histidine kinase [Natronincola ferrireducens]SDJ91568.1 two-component system, sensor histidine kinase YcbA [Natronincola ferrireducens]